jgi:hypothetical protein
VLRTLLLASFLMGGAIFMAIVFTGMFMVSIWAAVRIWWVW